ncbi:hypothetical protein [Zavarzinella formosa]|uniref:hypothetical protein n=1 Tax=Zavarzinella formosa TaxID=360055 RepID=UPI0002E478ED|nr:hypothetical protein [Zavarzinella formosa]
MGICGADIVRVKIAMALWKVHAVGVPDEERDRWEVVGDVIRSVIVHAERKPSPAEAEALFQIRQIIANGWGVHPEEIKPEAGLFGGGLELDGPERFRW